MMFKKCRCGKIIPQSLKICEICSETNASRHMEYNRTRRTKKSADFYKSSPWKRTRVAVLADFDGIDMFAYYVNNELLEAQEVHHIEELEDNWSRRFDTNNLIPLNHNTHTSITKLYKRSKATKKQTQCALNMLIEYHLSEQGDIKKVLREMQNVAPTLFCGENSPLGFSER